MSQTAADFHIGVCRACGRYGQLSKEGRVCALPDPPAYVALGGKRAGDFFRRTRTCQSIAKRRADRGQT